MIEELQSWPPIGLDAAYQTTRAKTGHDLPAAVKNTRGRRRVCQNDKAWDNNFREDEKTPKWRRPESTVLYHSS